MLDEHVDGNRTLALVLKSRNLAGESATTLSREETTDGVLETWLSLLRFDADLDGLAIRLLDGCIGFGIEDANSVGELIATELSNGAGRDVSSPDFDGATVAAIESSAVGKCGKTDHRRIIDCRVDCKCNVEGLVGGRLERVGNSGSWRADSLRVDG
jgi:hypothetical protein